MTRKNRLKKILKAMGFKIHEVKQPVDQDLLDRIGISNRRIKDLMNNRSDKPDLSLDELDAICAWLGITPNDLLVPKGKERVEEQVKVEISAKVSIYTPGSHLKQRPDLFSVNA